MSKKRVLITSWLQGPGGIETHLLTLSRLLVQHGAEVTVAARVCKPGVPLETVAPDVPLKFLKTPFAADSGHLRLSTVWAMVAWPLRFRKPFDAILTFEHSKFTRVLRRSLKPGGLVVGAYAGDLPNSAQARAARQNCDVLLVESRLHADAFRRLSDSDFRIAVAPHLGHYADPPASKAFSSNVLRVGFLGRFDRSKGVHRLLELWPKLDIGPAELHFYGAGPEELAIRSAISDHSPSAVFVHGGWSGADELRAILAAIDLIVLPSASEGLPIVLLEAMAHGVPFVATDVGAVRTLAEENPDVAVVPIADASLIAALGELTARIRSGNVSPARLQRYFAERFSAEKTRAVWLEALLDQERFWSRESRHVVVT